MTAAEPPPTSADDPTLDAPLDPAHLVERLRATFAAEVTRPLVWRREQLVNLRRLLTEHEDRLAAALAADLGKSAIESYLTEIAFCVGELDHTLKHLESWAEPERVKLPVSQRPGRAEILREPLGVALVIAPWNYPVQLLVLPLAAALSAGNCVVAKPSELAPATSAELARLVPQYLDTDAVAVVEGDAEVATALLDQRWDHIFFTGSTRVGRVVMQAAAKHLTPVTLELGGKSPAIVDRSARVDVAARRIAWGKLLNAGQTCIAPDYVLAHADVVDELTDAIVDAIGAFLGDDPAASDDYARIVSDRHLRRLEGLLAGDHRVVVGGEVDHDARYLAPTVLRDVDPGAPVMTEEIFGPILPVLAVASIDEAVAFVAAREKPLALYVFTEDDDVADRVLAGTSAGGTCVNHTLLHLGVPDLPFGGVGESGTGAYHGRTGFETFSHRRSVLRKPTRPDPSVLYPPYGRWKQKLLRTAR